MPPDAIKREIQYEPDTGRFLWLVSKRGPVKAGDEAGSFTRGYVRVKFLQRSYLAHRLAWWFVYGEEPEIIDHINGDPADNRIVNLRDCTQRQNGKNVAAVGASFDPKRGKWMARICVDYLHINLGRYATREEAVEVARLARIERFGEFARDAGV